ncbi:signal peptide peptidase SppA [Schlesneria paludicola]|uniref:signal peptide peptidase SppA n=1 Tax=Schlesneria paludicola TaxID=360056 RepID=UPI0002D482C8|nr:signal peptide peptidase SppA [Schlesneria paludicola]
MMYRFTAFLVLFGTASTLCAQQVPADAAKVTPVELTVAHIEIKGQYSEGNGAGGLFSEAVETLGDALARLKKAAADDRLDAVVLHISSPHIGWAKLNELRGGIAKIRQKGRKVFAWMESADTKDYLLASACDQIILPESGMLMLPGLRAEISFYKNLFDMLAIQPEMLRVGEFKSAAEPYSRSEMSPAFREEMEAILDDYYRQIVEMVAESRKLTQDQVKTIIDTGLFSAEEAKKQGLIDHVAYEDHLSTLIKAGRPNTEIKQLKGYGKKKIDTDFSGFTGMAKMMNLLMGVEPSSFKSKNPKIAVVSAVGPIVSGVSQSGFFGDESMGSTTMIKAIRQARDDDSVKAVILRVDSPGGSALASDLMWHELETLDGKKPLIVSMGDVAASGGYYIAMGADRIFAEPGTLTGSIGVVGGKVALEKFFAKIGITTSVVQRGKNAGVLSTTKPWTDAERDAMQKMMNDIYAQFTQKAAAGRKMDYDKLEKLARGRVYTGTQALNLGLVDELGTLDDAIAYAKKAAKLDPDSKLERLNLPKPTSPFEALFGPIDPSVKLAHGMAATWLEGLPNDLAEQLRNLASYEILAREKVLTIMPFQLQVK